MKTEGKQGASNNNNYVQPDSSKRRDTIETRMATYANVVVLNEKHREAVLGSLWKHEEVGRDDQPARKGQ